MKYSIKNQPYDIKTKMFNIEKSSGNITILLKNVLGKTYSNIKLKKCICKNFTLQNLAR